MPFSQSAQIPAILGYAQQVDPRSVLDVGTGMGQYGFLLRNNLESEHLFEIRGKGAAAEGRQRPRAQWRVTIDGIEGFAHYLTPVHDWAYSRMIVGEALAELAKIEVGHYDLVMAIDILEHFDTADGIRFAQACRRVARRAALISTPKTFVAQVVDANPLENHRSVWSEAQLASLGYRHVIPDAESWIAVWEAG